MYREDRSSEDEAPIQPRQGLSRSLFTVSRGILERMISRCQETYEDLWSLSKVPCTLCVRRRFCAGCCGRCYGHGGVAGSLGSSVSGVNHGGEFRSSVDPSQLATPFASQSCKV